jgi:hypothetical protein
MLLTSGSSKSKIDEYVLAAAIRAPGAKTAAQQFANDLYKKPADAVQWLKDNNMLFVGELIYTVKKLLNHLPLVEQLALQKAVISPETGKECENFSELLNVFETSTALKDYLKTLSPPKVDTDYIPDQIKVNPVNGLSLIAANPLSASVIMEYRKAQNKLAEARLVRLVPAAFPVSLPYGILAGGGNLDPLMPVEMRGAGPMIAAMRAGSYGSFALGTVGYPTQWRPVSDSTFIANQLETSLAQVTSALDAKGIKIDPDVKKKVEEVNKDLKEAEEDVKKNRDILTKYNNMLSSGEVLPKTSAESSISEMEKIVEKYNTNMKLKNKSEVKILRVLAVLASKLY